MNLTNATQPLVSIITGYYNRPDNLIQSVQSILDQDYTNFEYIIFDDNSTDNTSELLNSFSDHRLKLYKHSTNTGLTKGLIRAIAQSNGTYIAIHGAGDISYPARIRKQVQLLEENSDIGIVGCKIEDLHNNNTTIYTPNNNEFTHGEVMYRKNLYYQTGGYNPLFKLGQFTHLKSEILKLSRGSFVNETLYKRIHFDNGITRNDKKRFLQKFYINYSHTLSRNDNCIISTDINDTLLKTFISLLKQNSNADFNIFANNYKGSAWKKLIIWLYLHKTIPKSLAIRLLS